MIHTLIFDCIPLSNFAYYVIGRSELRVVPRVRTHNGVPCYSLVQNKNKKKDQNLKVQYFSALLQWFSGNALQCLHHCMRVQAHTTSFSFFHLLFFFLFHFFSPTFYISFIFYLVCISFSLPSGNVNECN